jgi:dTDP-4-dehydrorhamnose 3,5-epimerase
VPTEFVQDNHSRSRQGTLRGLHFQTHPGQGKLVRVARGRVLDVVVDLRVGSPTFGQHDTVLLDDVDRAAVYVSEGLGHAYMCLEDGSAFLYLCSAPYAPGREHGVNPLDPELDIEWPTTARDGRPLTPVLSPKDSAAPGLAEAADRGLLPAHQSVLAFRRSLAD